VEHSNAGHELEWTDSLGFHIRRAEQAVAGRKAEAFRTLGLTVPQALTLCLLLDDPGKSCTHLGRESGVTSQTMTGIINNLESKALVTREVSPDHARVHLFTLTDDGREVAAQARVLGMGIEEDLMNGVHPAVRERMIDALSRLAELAPTAGVF
jgi:DNA-binding MarR family transcriptional regulator